MDDRDEMGEMDDRDEMGERGDRSEDDSGEVIDRGEDEVGDRGDRGELDSAREAILEADEHASGSIHEQLQSLEEGIFEEEEGVHTQDEPGPKVDRITEVSQKLDALAERANERETAESILEARDHLRRYLKDHPQGG